MTPPATTHAATLTATPISTPAATPMPETRPMSGRMSRSSSRPKSTTLSEGPTSSLVDDLEKLGTVDKRHEELKRRVDELERQMGNKADKDDVSGSMIPIILHVLTVKLKTDRYLSFWKQFNLGKLTIRRETILLYHYIFMYI